MNEPTDIKLLTTALAAERTQRAELQASNAELQASNAELQASNAELQASNAELRERVAELEAQLTKVLVLLGQNSSNSNKPPSSDPPNAKQAKKKQKGRHRGGQPGHRGSHRKLLPPEQVDAVVDLFPDECESCWKPLPQVPDKFAKLYQLTELKPLAAHTSV